MTDHARSDVDSEPAAPEGPPLSFGFDPRSRRMTVHGELDFASGPILVRAIATLYGRSPGTVTIDIHGLEFTDAASLTLFLASCKALHAEGVPLLIEGATLTARRACNAAGLEALLAKQAGRTRRK
jgi:anti-anti-sigma factor